MKKLLLIFTAALSAACAQETAQVVTPTPKQVEWADAEIGVMFHFDLPVFNQEYEWREWGTHPDPDTFNPTELDTDQWIESSVKLGARYAILVAKHCCGFSLWPTKAHGYSVANCTWGDGKRDIVAEFIASCRKYGVKPGIYASTSANGYCWVDNPGTVKPGSPFTQEEYGKIVETQLNELWGNYGELFEVWFDGGVLRKEELKCDVLGIADRLQPDAVKFGAPEGFSNRIRWVGNEEGFSPDPCWATCDTGEADRKFGGDPSAHNWDAGEADFTLRWNSTKGGGWFWYEGEDEKIFTLPQLMEKYEKSVGRNTNMLLGVVIDNRGLIPDGDVARMAEFGAGIRSKYGSPLKSTSGRGSSLEMKLSEPASIDRLIIQEDITKGERVLEYVVEGRLQDGSWCALAHGTNIGHKRIATFRPVRLTGVKLTVKSSKAKPHISNFAVFAE